MSNDRSEGCFWTILGLFIAVPLGLVANACLVLWNWTWFAVPLGAPPIHLAHAAGIALLASVFTANWNTPSATDGEKSVGARVGVALLLSLCRFGFYALAGLAIHGIMTS